MQWLNVTILTLILFKGAEALICLLTDRIDTELLDAAGNSIYRDLTVFNTDTLPPPESCME